MMEADGRWKRDTRKRVGDGKSEIRVRLGIGSGSGNVEKRECVAV
jgi:hypothetical protein